MEHLESSLLDPRSTPFYSRIGFMQGRLSPLVNEKIQAFPVLYWKDEFLIADQNHFSLMEWTIDHTGFFENPLMSKPGRQEIRRLAKKHGIRIQSLTGDNFMQAPFYKTTSLTEKMKWVDELHQLVEACADLEIHHVLIPLVDNGRLETKEQEDCLRNELHKLAPTLKAANTKILFESDYEPEKLAKFLQTFEENIVALNYDIGNSASLGFNPELEIKLLVKYIANVHVKDRILGGTTVPLGEGNAQFPKVFSLLREINYQGNYILQTARAFDGDHTKALNRYRNMVLKWLEEN